MKTLFAIDMTVMLRSRSYCFKQDPFPGKFTWVYNFNVMYDVVIVSQKAKSSLNKVSCAAPECFC